MKNREKRLQKVRDFLTKSSYDAIIIPSGDPHFGEYVQSHYACREWLTGFAGSAGTVVVTRTSAALWTDSRYFTEAEQRLAGSNIELMKMRLPGTPSITEWLKDMLAKDSVVAIDSNLFSVNEYNEFKKELTPLKVKLIKDPFTELWIERPSISFGPASVRGLEITGLTTVQKLNLVCNRLNLKGKFLYILSTCDDIAWMCNIRGEDVPYNPLLISYGAFTDEKFYLFCSENAVTDELSSHLSESGVEVSSYKDFHQFVADFPIEYQRVSPAGKISAELYSNAVSKGAQFTPDTIAGGVVAYVKAVKNEVEIAGFRRAMHNDAIAWVKFWMFLEEKILQDKLTLTERELALKMMEIRGENQDYRGESFSPIVAYGESASLPHYSTFTGEERSICREGFLLVDTGAQYLYGTTDTTRTFVMGDLTKEQIRDYTLVLKGMINLSMAHFPAGTRGASLDILARGAVCTAGKLYTHGTGHGIGHNLCVHEGPQSIRMEDNPVAIEPGMVLSNEPAVYEEGRYGIRVENTILCTKWEENRFGTFYRFETLTLVPVDISAIDKSLLGSDALEWINRYHARVYNELSPSLNEKERVWLAGKCLHID
jgi:Xaa-Pro aminopeptidase